MASSMLAQVNEKLPILDETLVQPRKLVGLETAVGCAISGFSHPPKSIGAQRQKLRSIHHTSRFQVARFDIEAQTPWSARCVLSTGWNVRDARARGPHEGHQGPDRRHLAM